MGERGNGWIYIARAANRAKAGYRGNQDRKSEEVTEQVCKEVIEWASQLGNRSALQGVAHSKNPFGIR